MATKTSLVTNPTKYADEFRERATAAGMSEDEIEKALSGAPGGSTASTNNTTASANKATASANNTTQSNETKTSLPPSGINYTRPSEYVLADTLTGQAKEGLLTGEIKPEQSYTFQSYGPAFGNSQSRSNAWLTPESILSLNDQTNTSNLSNLVGFSKDVATNTKDASEMSAEELLQFYLNKAFDTREYKGLSEEETNDIVNRLQEQAQKTEEDTMGKYASMTGGIPSTAAVQQAAKSGADVMSQLQDVLDSKEQEKYEQYQDEQSTAYNNLYKLMSLYGYNTGSDTSGTSSGSSTSSTQTSNGSLSTEFNSPTVMNQIASAAGYDTTSLPSYSSWLNNTATWLGTDTDADVSVGKIIKTADPATLMNNLEEKYPNDFIFRMAYIIDYLYDNGYLTGTEKNEWLQNSGLSAWYKIAASGNYN